MICKLTISHKIIRVNISYFLFEIVEFVNSIVTRKKLSTQSREYKNILSLSQHKFTNSSQVTIIY